MVTHLKLETDLGRIRLQIINWRRICAGSVSKFPWMVCRYKIGDGFEVGSVSVWMVTHLKLETDLGWIRLQIRNWRRIWGGSVSKSEIGDGFGLDPSLSIVIWGSVSWFWIGLGPVPAKLIAPKMVFFRPFLMQPKFQKPTPVRRKKYIVILPCTDGEELHLLWLCYVCI